VPGLIDRTESMPPFGLMSDHLGQLNPWDTTAVDDGDYVLSVTVAMADGRTFDLDHPFTIDNAPEPEPAPEANLTVSGLSDGQSVTGDLFVTAAVDQPAESVQFEVPGHVDRTERHAPFALASDAGPGKINPWDTTELPNGSYTLRVTATLTDGRTLERTVDFTVAHPQTQPEPKPEPQPEPEPTSPQIAIASVPDELEVGQTLSISVEGIEDGQELFYHVFSHDWSDLIAKNVVVEGGRVLLTVPDAPGQRRLQLQWQDKLNPHKEVVIRSETEPEPAPEPEPDPQPEPEPLPEPEPEPQPEPDPTPATLNIEGLEADQMVEGKLFVYVSAGEKVESVKFVIPGVIERIERSAPYALASDVEGRINPWDTRTVLNGEYVLDVTATFTGGASIAKSLGFTVNNPDPKPEPEPDPTPAPPGDGPLLSAGSGFSGPTPAPSARGGLTTNAIARWDVVPEQMFRGEFEAGVVAFHSFGIERVDFSFNGGPWVSVTAPSHNPRTKVDEYWVRIDAGDVPDGLVELRAIAYPKQGRPRVLEPLRLIANSGGSVKFPVLELDAGTHEISHSLLHSHGIKPVKDGYLVIRGKPGVDRSQVRIKGTGNIQWKDGNVKFENLTVLGAWTNMTLRGNDTGMLWCDNVHFKGHTRNGDFKKGNWIWWPASQWTHYHWTDSRITEVQIALGNTENNITGVVRNLDLQYIYEDIVRMSGLLVNIKADHIGFGGKVVPGAHADAFQWFNWRPENLIVQNFRTSRLLGQGLFTGQLKDCAFVNLNLDNRSGVPSHAMRALQMQNMTENVLIQDSVFVGPGNLRYDKGFEPHDLVFRDIKVGDSAPYLPAGWQHSQITVLPTPPYYD